MKKKIIFLGYSLTQTNLIKFLRSKKNIVRIYRNRNLNRKIIEKADLIISFGYRKIIKSSHLKFPKRPIINLHISYLPYNRGSHPNFWSFMKNTPKGVSIHEMSDKLDCGPIVFRKKISFSTNENSYKKTYIKLINEAEKLFRMSKLL